MRDHTKLEAYQRADELVLAVYRATKTFPVEERFGLTSQLRRAAVSVVANIVEGSARAGQAEYVHLLSMAYGSAKEVQYEISLCTKLGYLRDAVAEDLARRASRTAMVLSALIAALRAAPPSGGRR